MSELAPSYTDDGVGGHPASAPETRRELTIIRGAFDGLERRVEELLERVGDYTRSPEPAATLTGVEKDPMPVYSTYACQLREVSTMIGRLEGRVADTLHRLEL